MDNAQLSTSVEGPIYIGQEEIEVLNDIKTRCYYPSSVERTRFIRNVCISVGVKRFEEILEDDFETAFNLAISILRNRGEQILRGKLQYDNLAKGLHYQGRR